MNKRLIFGLGLLGLVAAAGVAIAQTYPPPQVSVIGATDLFQDVVGGAPQAQNYYAAAPLLGNYGATQPGNNAENALIGGDFGTNLFAYGATVSNITTSTTYVANRWFAWSGTSTTLAGAQETGSADIPADYEASLRITRSGSGIVQSCVAQAVESVNSYAYGGTTAEFDFHALAGSGFSAASSNLAVYIVTGTALDEGSGKMAYSINAGGGAGAGWTGAAVLGGTTGFLVPIATGWQRYTVAAPIAAGIKEIGVAICWTPVGASPSSDYFDFTGAQLTRNSALTSVAGSAGAFIGANDGRAKAFARRSQQIETGLQQRYYWVNNEVSVNAMGLGVATATTQAKFYFQNPMTMRTTPTAIATVGSLQTTNSIGTATTLTALAAVTNGSSINGVELVGTVAGGLTIGNGALMTSNSGSGAVGGNAEE